MQSILILFAFTCNTRHKFADFPTNLCALIYPYIFESKILAPITIPVYTVLTNFSMSEHLACLYLPLTAQQFNFVEDKYYVCRTKIS